MVKFAMISASCSPSFCRTLFFSGVPHALWHFLRPHGPWSFVPWHWSIFHELTACVDSLLRRRALSGYLNCSEGWTTSSTTLPAVWHVLLSPDEQLGCPRVPGCREVRVSGSIGTASF